ncbi:hypothetical protein B0O99DRAFT_594253 [Bisporella sp. PMI_857]|nr:hypothetical protein B0O99DRAFT_594253 [Bisporella sp. PMI_857]
MAATTRTPTATRASTVLGQSTDVIALTTTFSPEATSCTENRLTMLKNREYEIWLNHPLPVPGTTMSDCYPTEFMSSFLLAESGITQSAFSNIVCPKNYYTAGRYTSNYIACCPTGYTLAPPKVEIFSDRPAYGGKCYTPIPQATPARVTQYGDLSVTATSTFSATDTLQQAYAYPIDGIATGVVEPVGIVVQEPTTTSASPTSTSAAGTTYTVLANTDPVFTPNTVEAKIGDTVLFQFMSGNHSVTQSSFETPCEPLSGGADSNYMANINNKVVPTPEYSFRVATTSPQWFFSKQTGECGKGMTFALNPTNEQSQAVFQAAAISQGSTSDTVSKSSKSDGGLSAGAKAGIAIAVIVPVIIIAFLIVWFIRRRNRNARQEPIHSPPAEYYSQDNKPSVIGTADGYRGYMSDAKENVPPVPPKGEEVHGESMRNELPGYTTYEMPGNEPEWRYNSNEEPSPVSLPSSKLRSPPQG